MTDYALVNHCGLLPATIALYGSEEGREEYFKHLRDSGAAGTGAFTEAMARETEKIIELGNDSARQADYIKSVLDQHVAAFLDSKECDGKSFPDFVGALILEEISSCLALRTKYRAYKQEEALKRQAEQEEQDRAFCEERNRKAEQMIDLAIRTIRGGGTLKNEPISLYKSRYDSSTYSIVNHLMRRYQVDVPLRTQGWINDKLISVTIENGKMEYHWYEDYWAMPRNLPRGHEFFIGYYQTQRAVHHHVAFIHTDQSCFLSTHLFDQGYRIFLHFKSGTVTEVGRGENPALPVWIIRENMNLEAPLLAGLLGKLTE